MTWRSWSTPIAAYAPEQAIALGGLLQEYGVCHFEEPCPYWKPDWTRAVKVALALDVTGGEQDNNLTLWKFLIESGTMDVAQPDVCYVGGVERFLRVARMAQDAGMPVTPHAANMSLVTIFTLHLMGALENAGPYVEFAIEGPDFYPWQYGIYDEMPVARDGKVEVPGRPRMGNHGPPGMAGEVRPSSQRSLIRCRIPPRATLVFAGLAGIKRNKWAPAGQRQRGRRAVPL